jgi:hypothetical protein
MCVGDSSDSRSLGLCFSVRNGSESVRRTVEARSVVAACLVEDGVSVDSDVGFPGLAVGGHMEDDCMQVVVGGAGGEVLNIVSIPLNFPVKGRLRCRSNFRERNSFSLVSENLTGNATDQLDLPGKN